ncbi:MAG: AAA family ATPase, partial [Gemmatimonadales bacterium]|nr:AAA family ATPase [Gemmatimonadales bacterium]
MNHPTPPKPPTGPSLPPAPLSQFIGREREVAAVGRLLETTRLLTLTGAGGSGKTRLAREVAGRIEAAGGAVLWADLSAVAD